MDTMAYKADVLRELRRLRRLAEAAASQLNDVEFFAAPEVDSNSVAVIVKHMAGNMHSRWRDFLTSDGEKPDRKRDAEFEISPNDTRSSLTARWNEGWSMVFGTIGSLRPDDFEATVHIRGEPHTVPQAINRHLTHTAYHVGQIVFVAKQTRGSEWRTLSVPKGKSDQYNMAPKKYIDERDE